MGDAVGRKKGPLTFEWSPEACVMSLVMSFVVSVPWLSQGTLPDVFATSCAAAKSGEGREGRKHSVQHIARARA